MKMIDTTSVGYNDISVDIIDYNQNLAEHIWNCYRMTWTNLQNVEYDVHNPQIKKAILDVCSFKALPMPREQAIITFRINHISRVCLAQLTRQRKATFNVESQMPQPIRHNVIIPKNIHRSADFRRRAEKLINDSQMLYDDMINAGIPPQDARYLTMHGQTTSLVYAVDIDTFRSSFNFRCENNLSDEINLVYRKCKVELLKKIIDDYSHDKIDGWTFYFYYETLLQLDCDGAKQHLGKNTDAVFGNSFARYPSADDDVTEATKNCDYDYKKSAWYLELIDIYRTESELLFPSEKEMIEKWINN